MVAAIVDHQLNAPGLNVDCVGRVVRVCSAQCHVLTNVSGCGLLVNVVVGVLRRTSATRTGDMHRLCFSTTF
jgi:hypothetical protein